MGRNASEVQVDWTAVDCDPLGALTAPEASAVFLQQTWQQQPALFKATPQRKALLAGVADKAAILALVAGQAEAGKPLEYGEDVLAGCCGGEGHHGHSHHHHGSEEGTAHAHPVGEATGEAMERLLRDAASEVQLRQPQRFSDTLWRLLAAMESQLGCLVGCTAVVAPRGARAPPPHFNGSEIFVVQTEGSSSWRLRRAAEGSAWEHCALTQADSRPLREEELGETLLEATLEVGDVLYIPAGTIQQQQQQQAEAEQAEAESAHLVLSTYKRWSWGDLLQYAVSVAVASPTLQALLPPQLKAGLPPAFLGSTALTVADAAQLAAGRAPAAAAAPGGSGDGGGRGALVGQVAAALRSLAEGLEARPHFGSEVLLAAGDTMAEEFVCRRLPPHPEQLLPPGVPPAGEDDLVAFRGRGLARLVVLGPGDAPQLDEEPDEESEEGGGGGSEEGAAGGRPLHRWVRLLASLQNPREAHMMAGDEEEGGHHHHHHVPGSGCCDSDGSEGEAAAEGGGTGAAAAARGRGASSGDGSGSVTIGSSSSELEEEEEEEEPVEEEEQLQEDLVFPAEFAPALLQLMGTAPPPGGTPEPIRLGDIALPEADLRLQLAAALWEGGVLATLSRAAAAQGKRAAAEAGGQGGKRQKKR